MRHLPPSVPVWRRLPPHRPRPQCRALWRVHRHPHERRVEKALPHPQLRGRVHLVPRPPTGRRRRPNRRLRQQLTRQATSPRLQARARLPRLRRVFTTSGDDTARNGRQPQNQGLALQGSRYLSSCSPASEWRPHQRSDWRPRRQRSRKAAACLHKLVV